VTGKLFVSYETSSITTGEPCDVGAAQGVVTVPIRQVAEAVTTGSQTINEGDGRLAGRLLQGWLSGTGRVAMQLSEAIIQFWTKLHPAGRARVAGRGSPGCFDLRLNCCPAHHVSLVDFSISFRKSASSET
jgi:hypothetical protein